MVEHFFKNLAQLWKFLFPASKNKIICYLDRKYEEIKISRSPSLFEDARLGETELWKETFVIRIFSHLRNTPLSGNFVLTVRWLASDNDNRNVLRSRQSGPGPGINTQMGDRSQQKAGQCSSPCRSSHHHLDQDALYQDVTNVSSDDHKPGHSGVEEPAFSGQHFPLQCCGGSPTPSWSSWWPRWPWSWWGQCSSSSQQYSCWSQCQAGGDKTLLSEMRVW